MPKAKPYPGGAGGPDSGDEEERTTIESQWEDEASTTVEQGEVAEKVRALKSNTNVTHTSAGAMDEPTMDDQHAPVLSAITPLRADNNARLAITQGNDTGQTFEIRPGKSFSVGRAIDNDIVLTDIAVSRKHFELRHEDGAWVIVDHRSGNGTVVNGNVEDNPFMLANGDTIEIGNTVFRFEQEKGAERPRRIEEDDGEEELSTVAGKPLRTSEIEEIEPAPTPVVAPRMQPRPKTLPPPTPLRSIGASQPPPLGLPPMAPQPASTLPLPQMANRPPMGQPGSPTMLGDSMGLPMQQPNMMGQPNMMMGQPMQNVAPTTIPGQGAPQRPSYPYPQATEIPPHSVHAQMLLVQSQNRRGDASTAHVPPMSYDPMNPMFAQAPMQPQRYSQPQISSRAKYIAAAAAIAVIAAIATIGIVKSGNKTKPVARTENGSAAKKNVTVDPIASKGSLAKTTTTPTTPTTSNPPKQDPPKQDPPKQDPPKGTVVALTPPKQDPPKQDPPKQDPPKQDPPKQDPPKQDPKQNKQVASSSKKNDKRVAARPPKKDEPKNDPAPSNKTVATADTSAAEAKAEELYKRRKFNDASTVLINASKGQDEEKARELRTTADYYVKLGKALNVATAPGMDAPKPYEALRRAATYDANLGGFYKSEIDTALGPAARSAAFKFVADKKWQDARTAVQTAEAHGAGDSVSTVKKKLDAVARDYYNEAQADNFQSQNSKDKLKQILILVEPGSTYAKKAANALAANH